MKKGLLFIFGSTGDLVRRKVIPALHSLSEEKNIGKKLGFSELEIWGLGRRDFDRATYQDFACHSNNCSLPFRESLHYFKINFEKDNFCQPCISLFSRDRLNFVYIALPPFLYPSVLSQLGELKKRSFALRILLEKPFGGSLQEAKKLKKLIEKEGLAVFLADHYLFKKAVFSLRPREFSSLEIVSLEKVGLEGRVSYYDQTGALKDMIQSHFLNITFRLLPFEKERLKNLSLVQFKRGQYQGYAQELGKPSLVETFVDLSFQTEGRSFRFVTGKKFAQKLSYLKIDQAKKNLEDEKAYQRMLRCFFQGKKEKFVSFSDSLLTWEITEIFSHQETSLEIYPDNQNPKTVL